MKKSVGIISVHDLDNLKHYSLIFDQIFISNPWENILLSNFPFQNLENFCNIETINADIAWLKECGFIFNYEPKSEEIDHIVDSDKIYQKYAN